MNIDRSYCENDLSTISSLSSKVSHKIFFGFLNSLDGNATFKIVYVLSGKESSFQVCVELNLKCWQCFPREINKDENREVLKRRVILFKAIERHIHIILC